MKTLAAVGFVKLRLESKQQNNPSLPSNPRSKIFKYQRALFLLLVGRNIVLLLLTKTKTEIKCCLCSITKLSLS